MTDYSAIEVKKEHVSVLRSFLRANPGASNPFEGIKNEIAATSCTLLVYAAFAVAVRREFAPKYTLSDVVQFVSALRTSAMSDAKSINPRVAEGMIRAALGDGSLKDGEPYGADPEAMVRAEVAVLMALVGEAGFDEAGLDEFVRDSAEFAGEWLAARQGQ